jgi:hypothetical protein
MTAVVERIYPLPRRRASSLCSTSGRRSSGVEGEALADQHNRFGAFVAAPVLHRDELGNGSIIR